MIKNAKTINLEKFKRCLKNKTADVVLVKISELVEDGVVVDANATVMAQSLIKHVTGSDESKMDKDDLISGMVISTLSSFVTIGNFTTKSGVKVSEFAVVVTTPKDGTFLYFGANNGIVSFYRAKIEPVPVTTLKVTDA